jgi:hypothetical protein
LFLNPIELCKYIHNYLNMSMLQFNEKNIL